VARQHGEAKAVLLNIESYQEMKNAFGILALIKLSEEDIKAGRVQSSDEVLLKNILPPLKKNPLCL